MRPRYGHRSPRSTLGGQTFSARAVAHSSYVSGTIFSKAVRHSRTLIHRLVKKMNLLTCDRITYIRLNIGSPFIVADTLTSKALDIVSITQGFHQRTTHNRYSKFRASKSSSG